MAKMILAHDLGTTGNKASLFDETGHLIESDFYGYETYFPDALSVEQDPDDYWEAVVTTTRRLLKNSGYSRDDVAVVSFSGQMMAALPVDQHGNPLSRILIWADRRGVEEVREISERVSPEEIYAITGHRLSANYSLAKILWIKKHLPDVYQEACTFLMAKDFIVFKLTGRMVSDFSDASGTNLFDLVKEEWSEEIVERVGIDIEKLPLLYSSIDVVGEVTREASEACGLRAGTPVVIGGGDGPCAATGAGVVREGQAYNYLGSSSWIALASDRPVYDPRKRTFTFHHLRKGLFTPTGTMQAAGGSLQWCRDALCDREKSLAAEFGISSYELMDLEAGKISPGSEGLFFLPYLMGERAPWWNPHARGAFIGLTPRHRKAHMIRSVLEGVSYNLRIILDAFREQGIPIENMRMIGGGARGDFWNKILASMFELEVLRPVYIEEATSLGAAIAGGVGVGIFSGLEQAEELVRIRDCFTPEPESQETYNRLYPLFTMAYLSLEEMFGKLGSSSI